MQDEIHTMRLDSAKIKSTCEGMAKPQAPSPATAKLLELCSALPKLLDMNTRMSEEMKKMQENINDQTKIMQEFDRTLMRITQPVAFATQAQQFSQQPTQFNQQPPQFTQPAIGYAANAAPTFPRTTQPQSRATRDELSALLMDLLSRNQQYPEWGSR